MRSTRTGMKYYSIKMTTAAATDRAARVNTNGKLRYGLLGSYMNTS